MKKASLLKKLKLLGYPLFETEEGLDANEVLAEVVKSRDARLWEGFPLLLANSMEKDVFQKHLVETHFKDTFDKKYFNNLVAMSYALFMHLHLKFNWLNKLNKVVSANENLVNENLKKFQENENLTTGLRNLSSDRVVRTFKNYFTETLNFQSYDKVSDDFSFEYALSQVFSKKQKELFMKKVKNEKMNKTEREYYSRTVKKKVLALSNERLHKLATGLIKK